jgi:3-hydroxyisobutyrate dehydrogenase-like beta-hydroxyacid dehydrogenase
LNDLVVQGATAFGSPAALASACDVVVTSLFNDLALDAVYMGTDGLFSGQQRGCLFIDTSTVQPATVVRLASEAFRAGASFVDAPVLGTVRPAREGQLLVLAGGTEADVLRAKTVLQHISRVVYHVGGVGSGAAMKLAVNIPMATYWAALADSFAVAHAWGLDAEQLAAIISDSPAALVQLKLKLPVLLGHSSSVGFHIDGVIKDCETTASLASAKNIELPTLKAACSVFRKASAAGWGAKDVAATPRLHLGQR